MSDLCLHQTTFTAISRTLSELISTGKRYRLSIREWKDKRSLSQNALSHLWYGEISKYLIRNGNKTKTPEWVKDAMKATHLGFEEKNYTNVLTGEITTKSELRKTSKLDTAQMHHYLTQVEVWAFSEGFILTIPERCEYQQLKAMQVA